MIGLGMNGDGPEAINVMLDGGGVNGGVVNGGQAISCFATLTERCSLKKRKGKL